MFHPIFERVLAEQMINNSKTNKTNMKKITQKYPQHSQGHTYSHNHIVTHTLTTTSIATVWHMHIKAQNKTTSRVPVHIYVRIKSRINEPLFLLKAGRRCFKIK
ncbi:hypothetical protein AMECASPLE_039627 [Ameca splendens]|uniref:Uncharacterized protein n=1 Tax=Ameca splendens TaxID=208324 RepID=A0ABV0XXD3_9TELE